MSNKGDGSQKISEKDSLKIELSLNQNTIDRISDVQKNYLEEEMNEVIPEIEDGQVNITGVYIFDEGDKFEAKIYIVNGLSRAINFEKAPLCIVNSKGEELGYEIFDLNEMGDIPPYSARPWKIYFDKKNVVVDEIPQDDWKIVFDSRIKAVTYANIELEAIPESLDAKEIATFKEFIATLPKLEQGQVSISVFTITQYQNDDLLMTLIARNGVDEPIKLEKLPITIETYDGRTVVNGAFDLENFEINAGKARILSLIFKKELLLEEEFDLASCKVMFNS
ncbi:SLAP domain-containing protein [Clostridium malenominatum]|uniref:SLAP domain-containing protein n=1 Tax=Clostridium malenominatum TaxID=1539 RepID=A0ABP3UCP0_9CLOT